MRGAHLCPDPVRPDARARIVPLRGAPGRRGVIEGWLKAIRDHPERPAAMQRHVLTMLALRMDWATGAGFAGIRDLMADADASKSTVMRGTSWARDEHFLIRTRRGHYISAQTTIASQ